MIKDKFMDNINQKAAHVQDTLANLNLKLHQGVVPMNAFEDCLYQMKLYQENVLEYFEDWGYDPVSETSAENPPPFSSEPKMEKEELSIRIPNYATSTAEGPMSSTDMGYMSQDSVRTPIKSIVSQIDEVVTPTLESLGLSSMTWALLNGGLPVVPESLKKNRANGSFAPSDFSVGTPPSMTFDNRPSFGSDFTGMIAKITTLEYDSLPEYYQSLVSFKELNEAIAEINNKTIDTKFDHPKTDYSIISDVELMHFTKTGLSSSIQSFASSF